MNELEKAAVISALATAVIAVVKLLAGTFFGSIALVADAIHSFTDIIGSIAVFFGVKFSDIKSKKFPYGLYKLENLVSLFLALIIFYTAFEILIDVIAGLGSPVGRAGPIAIVAAVFSLVVSYLLAKYKFRVGKKENSPSMLSEAKHTKLDAVTTVGVLAAVILSYAGFPIADPIIGFAIAILVFKAGAEIFIDSARVLLDVSLDYKTMRKIEKIAERQKDVTVSDLVARSSGRYIFVDLKLETDIKDLKRVNQIRERCEEKIISEVPHIDKIMIDIKYRKKDVLKYAVPLMEKKKGSPIAPEFGSTPYFGFFSLTNRPGKKKILENSILKNPYAGQPTRKGIMSAEWLSKQNADVLVVQRELRKGGSYYALQENFVEIQETKAKTFKEVMEKAKQYHKEKTKKQAEGDGIWKTQ